MKSHKIKDNRPRKKEELSDITALTSKIADKTLRQLESEGVFVFPETIDNSKDISHEQIILQSINENYWTGNVMGFLGYGDERLIIESRFSQGKDDYFFQYLLKKVLDFPNFINLQTDANQDNRLFNFLLFLFPNLLKEALRKGLYKSYVHRRYNDANIKGAIDITRHILENTPFVGNVAYNTREFSYDNVLTQLVRHTIEFIKSKPEGKSLLPKIKDEIKLIISATPNYEVYDRQKIISTNEKNEIRHAYFREYRALQNICLLILRYSKHQIGLGTKRIYGLLFDGAWLWEEYINTLVKDIFHHPMNKAHADEQHLFHKNIGLIYPDFISKSKNSRVIGDAKYKPIGNIASGDYLQLLAYMFRFDAKTGYYFYPEVGETKSKTLCLNCGSSFDDEEVRPRSDVSVIKHGLKIPLNVCDYNEFVSKMNVSENEFLSALV